MKLNWRNSLKGVRITYITDQNLQQRKNKQKKINRNKNKQKKREKGRKKRMIKMTEVI